VVDFVSAISAVYLGLLLWKNH